MSLSHSEICVYLRSFYFDTFDNEAKPGTRRLFVGNVTIEMLPAGRDISARHCLDFRHSWQNILRHEAGNFFCTAIKSDVNQF